MAAKITKIITNTVVACTALIVIAVLAVYVLSSIRMNRRYALVASQLTVASGPAAIADGQRLFVTRGCIDCHGADLSGKTIVDDPAIGKFAGTNLTSGKGGVASSLSDSAFALAIRQGIGPSGRALIFMPSTDYQDMSDDDVSKIIAYIRSRPPVDKPSIPQTVGPMARLLFLTGKMPNLLPAELINHQAKPPVHIAVAETVAYGHYLTNMCTGCHGKRLSGGPIPGGAPNWPPAKDITPAGLEHWNKVDFIKAMRTGVLPDGSILKAPMPWQNFSQLTNVELTAMWMYLRTVSPVAFGNH